MISVPRVQRGVKHNWISLHYFVIYKPRLAKCAFVHFCLCKFPWRNFEYRFLGAVHLARFSGTFPLGSSTNQTKNNNIIAQKLAKEHTRLVSRRRLKTERVRNARVHRRVDAFSDSLSRESKWNVGIVRVTGRRTTTMCASFLVLLSALSYGPGALCVHHVSRVSTNRQGDEKKKKKRRNVAPLADLRESTRRDPGRSVANLRHTRGRFSRCHLECAREGG